MIFFIKALLLNKINSIIVMFIFMSYDTEINTVSECNVSSWKKKISQAVISAWQQRTGCSCCLAGSSQWRNQGTYSVLFSSICKKNISR